MPNNVDNMTRRQEAISDIIRRQAVSSQAQLSELLAARGIRVTQSCISRDLSMLGAVKRGRAYSVASSDISQGDRQMLALQRFRDIHILALADYLEASISRS